MIHFTQGNLLDSDAQALVNTVNTVGVMGKGIALQFKKAYPLNYDRYRKACAAGEVKVGAMFVVEDHDLKGSRTIINFPTKQHWRGKSKLEWVVDGLDDLKNFLKNTTIASIAIPPLGCGHGGLKWQAVRPLTEEKLAEVPQDVYVYEPNAESKAQLRGQQSSKPLALNPARAMLLETMFRYEDDFKPVSFSVANKLVYFLKRLGGPFDGRVSFTKSYNGPYSPAVNHVVGQMNGHYVTVIEQHTARPFETLELNNLRYGELKQYLARLTAEQQAVLTRLDDLLDGYKSALALEILATVDFIRQRCPDYTTEQIIEVGREWSQGKTRLLQADYVAEVAERLDRFFGKDAEPA